MFNKHDISRNQCQLFWHQAEKGYDWWWHSFTGHHAETGEEKAFFIEYFLCNPLHGSDRLIDRIHAENIGCEYGEYDR